jgi:enoyl-CoA hydratase
MAEDIVFTQKRHIGLITLQRLQALNALTLPMILALQDQLNLWKNDNSIHAVVIQAAAGKAFCAGGDVLSLYEERHATQQQLQFFWHEYRLNYFIHDFGKPYIALMDGITMGGGVGISLHGSHPVASEHFLFAMPETGIGFFPDIGASYLLARSPGQLGMYLGLTGNRLGAADAKALGLVKHLVPADKFQKVLVNLIEADLSIDAHIRVDACIQSEVMSTEPAPLIKRQSIIDDCFNGVDMESILSSLISSSNQVDDIWHRDTLNTLMKKSPLSLKVSFAQLQKAKTMSMAECIKMDYCLVGHFMRDNDFYEGVRALLVDKDKTPSWQPSSLSSVTHAMVADYFECGQPELPLIFGLDRPKGYTVKAYFT